MAENAKVRSSLGCMGAEPEQIEAAYPACSRSRGRSTHRACWTPCSALPPAHNPHLDLVPPQGVKPTPRHYALFRRFPRAATTAAASASSRSCAATWCRGPANDVLREAEKLVKAGVGELLVISRTPRPMAST